MTFRPLSRRVVRWRPVDGEGLEHLDVASTPDGILARSVLVGERGGVFYTIDCSPDWIVRSFDIRSTDGRSLSLSSNGNGRWFDADGIERHDFAGCIDIDLEGTPFTNTLPIRRLDPMREAEPLDCRMLYVSFDSFEPRAMPQRYTALSGRRFRYESGGGRFSADLTVDEDGLVIDYPSLFCRVPTIDDIGG